MRVDYVCKLVENEQLLIINITIVIHIRIAHVAKTILISVLLSRVESTRAIVAGVPTFVIPILVPVQLVRVGD